MTTFRDIPLNENLVEPSLWDTFGSAFRQENDLYNGLQALARRHYEPDPDFDFIAEAKKSKYWTRAPEALLGAVSRADLLDREARIGVELRDKQMLSEQGWAGMLAMMVAGTVSPTIFMPFIGQARGAKAAAEAFKWSAVAATVQELPLIANQLARTPEESAASIAASTVLGGLLGSAAGFMRKPLKEFADEIMTGGVNPKVLHKGGVESAEPDVELKVSEMMGSERPRATPGAVLSRALPDVPADFTRYYSTPLPEARLTTNIDEAAQAVDAPAYHVDLPNSDPRVVSKTVLTFEERDEILSTVPKVEVPEVEIPVSQSVGAKATKEPFAFELPVVRDGKTVWEPIATPEEIAEAGARFAPIGPLVNTEWLPEWVPSRFRGKFGLFDWIAYTSPIFRGVSQFGQPVKSPRVSQMFAELSDSGLRFEANKFGVVPSGEGTVESRLSFFIAKLAGAFARKQYDLYLRYISDGDPSFMDRRLGGVNIELDRAPRGKISWSEFKTRVDRASNFGDSGDPIPEVNESAQAMREAITEVDKAASKAASVWGKDSIYPDWNPKEEGETYNPRVYDPDLVAEHRQEFITLVKGHFEQVMTASYKKRVERLMKKITVNDTLEEVSRMEIEDALKYFDELGKELKLLPDAGDLSADVDRVRALRQEARELREAAFEELEKNNVGGDPEITKNNKKNARADTKDEVTKLMDLAQSIEDRLPKAVEETRKKGKELRALRKAVNQGFARVEERQQALLEQIEKNETMNVASFERVIREHDRFLRGMMKMDPEALAKELKRVRRSFELAVNAMLRADTTLRKAEPDSLAYVLADLESAMSVAKITAKLDELKRVEARDTEQVIAALKSTRQEAFERINKINNKRAERNVVLRQQARKLTPEEVETRLRTTRSALDKQVEDLEMHLSDAGAIDIDVRTGRFDFSGIAEDLAVELAAKLEGNYGRSGEIDALTWLRSPMRRRILDLPYDKLQKFLVTDTERKMAKYLRTMGSDIELFRQTGSVNGETYRNAIEEEFKRMRTYVETRQVDERGKQITEKRRKKEAQAIREAKRLRLREWTASVDRLRGLWGVPKSAPGLAYRMGRLLINSNIGTMMGVSTLSSASEAARVVMGFGFHKTFKHSWAPFIKSLVDESTKAKTKKELLYLRWMGIGDDMFTNMRSRGNFDFMGHDFSSKTGVERFFEWTANKMPLVALYGPWTDAMKMQTAKVVLAKLMTELEAFNSGVIDKEAIAYMAEVGISTRMARRIRAELERTSEPIDGMLVPNVAEWKDYDALRVFQAALSREDSKWVITPGLEKPLWMDETMPGRLLGQFRSFTMASHVKIVASSLQQRNMAAFHLVQGATFSLALGAVSYYLWAMTAGPRAREEMRNATWEQWFDQAWVRSGLAGGFSIPQDIALEFPVSAKLASLSGTDIAGRRADNVWSAVAGPSFGKLSDLFGVGLGIDQPTQGTTNVARQLVPWQNVFYLKWAFEALEQGTNDFFDLPERRK